MSVLCNSMTLESDRQIFKKAFLVFEEHMSGFDLGFCPEEYMTLRKAAFEKAAAVISEYREKIFSRQHTEL